jgi:hypothetical protein
MRRSSGNGLMKVSFLKRAKIEIKVVYPILLAIHLLLQQTLWPLSHSATLHRTLREVGGSNHSISMISKRPKNPRLTLISQDRMRTVAIEIKSLQVPHQQLTLLLIFGTSRRTVLLWNNLSIRCKSRPQLTPKRKATKMDGTLLMAGQSGTTR